MPERVEALELGVVWEPNAPEAVLLSGDFGATSLALQAHTEDPDRRCVVLEWAGCRFASMGLPNDEAISGHRLWRKGLSEARWAGRVLDSELIAELERQNRIHPSHDPLLFEDLTHFVVPLKECVVEVVASTLAVRRAEGTTAEAAAGARD